MSCNCENCVTNNESDCPNTAFTGKRETKYILANTKPKIDKPTTMHNVDNIKEENQRETVEHCTTEENIEELPQQNIKNDMPSEEVHQVIPDKKVTQETEDNFVKKAGKDETTERKQFFKMIHGKLKRITSYTELKVESQKIEKDIQSKHPIKQLVQGPTNFKKCQASEEVYPSDAPRHMMPVEIYGDGNCLPRCASMIAYGVQDHFTEMRSRIVIELCVHDSFYLESRNLTDTCSTSKHDYAKLYAQYSGQIIPNRLTKQAIKKLYEDEVMSIIESGSYMGIWQIHAIATIIKSKLKSIFPIYGGATVREHLNRLISPRDKQNSSDGRSRVLMWTNTNGKTERESDWSTNHVVVCVRYK